MFKTQLENPGPSKYNFRLGWGDDKVSVYFNDKILFIIHIKGHEPQ